jgi:formiminotetrahydrofolate cyclodeaminase
LDNFLKELAQPKPDPGGGSAAAYVGAVATGLALKVLKLEIQRSSNVRQIRLESLLTALQGYNEQFLSLVRADEEAYKDFMESRKTGGGRLSAAIVRIIDVPIQIGETALKSLCIIESLDTDYADYLTGDVSVVSELLYGIIVGINEIIRSNMRIRGSDPVSVKEAQWNKLLNLAHAQIFRNRQLLSKRN